MSIRIYVEGGASSSSKSDCRRAFRIFFEKVITPGSFQIIASGDRASTYKDFCIAVRQRPSDDVILLVDSEQEVKESVWEHLRSREGDGWRRPSGVTENQAHLMVQVMEAWFLADKQALAEFYGQGFLIDAIPKTRDIESIRKARVYEVLAHATKNTKTKGEYHKTKHGFDLLERINPKRVREASAHAARLMNLLEEKAGTE